MSYAKQEIKEQITSALTTPEKIYNNKWVNRKGRTSDSKELYSEVIAEELLFNLHKLREIPVVHREETYSPENHSKIIIDLKYSNKNEEIFAKRLVGLELDKLGAIKNYQIPLKDKNSDKTGKIDLLSFNEKAKTLYIIKLKYKENEESLLRAILESYTYFKTVDQEKLIKDQKKLIEDIHNDEFLKELSDYNSDDIKVKPAVLVVPECSACEELNEIKNENRPKLEALAKALEVDCFILGIDVH